MITRGNIHSSGGKLARYMLTGQHGERAELFQMRGMASANVYQEFAAMQAIADTQTECEKPFFHAYMRLAPGEALEDGEWLSAADLAEAKLGFKDQPRLLSFHVQENGDKHMHMAWFRINTDTMKAIDPGLYINKLREASRELEQTYGLEVLANKNEAHQTGAASRAELEQSRRLGMDNRAIREAIREAFQASDNGVTFVAALEERGLMLAAGERRDFVIIDQAGGTHALSKRITGMTAAEMRDRLGGDTLRTALHNVEQTQALQEARQQAQETAQGPNVTQGQAQAASPPEKSREAMQAELTALWQASDTGRAFLAAAEAEGYAFAQGDRGVLLIDAAGDHHALSRMIDGARAKDVRAKLADIDPLPSLDDALAQRQAEQQIDQTPDLNQAPPDHLDQAPAPESPEEPYERNEAAEIAAWDEALFDNMAAKAEAEDKAERTRRAGLAPDQQFDRAARETVANRPTPTPGDQFRRAADHTAGQIERQFGWAADQTTPHSGEPTSAEQNPLDHARIVQDLLQRRATFNRKDIQTHLRGMLPDEKARNGFIDQLLSGGDVVTLSDPTTKQQRFTTRDILLEEARIAAAAERVSARDHHTLSDEARSAALAKNDFLDPEQRAALDWATRSNGLAILAGEAGTGKSATMNAIRQAYEADGYRVEGVAWTNAVIQDMQKSGFDKTSTLAGAMLRNDKGRGTWDGRTVLMVDEAGMLSNDSMAALLRHAQAAGAKVVMAGDVAQLASIERGGMFGQMQTGLGAAELHHVRRVADTDQKEAFNQMHKGDFDSALATFNKLGAVQWSKTTDDASRALADQWAADSAADPTKSRFAFAFTNEQVNDLNSRIRAIRRERGELGDDVLFQTKDGPAAFAIGDRITFGGNGTKEQRAEGLFNGGGGIIQGIEENRVSVRIDGKDGEPTTLFFTLGDNAEAGEFNAVRHGYAGTIYKGQGKTLDQTYLLHSDQWRDSTSYVALSRHRDTVKMFATEQETPWMAVPGGLDALSEKQREAAARSFEKWSDGRADADADNGRERKPWELDKYVAFVQGKYAAENEAPSPLKAMAEQMGRSDGTAAASSYQIDAADVRAWLDEQRATLAAAFDQSVIDTRQQTEDQRRAFLQERPATRIELALDSLLTGTTNKEFVAGMHGEGLRLARATADDIAALKAEFEAQDPTSTKIGLSPSSQKIEDGELVVINRWGGVHRLNPEKIDAQLAEAAWIDGLGGPDMADLDTITAIRSGIADVQASEQEVRQTFAADRAERTAAWAEKSADIAAERKLAAEDRASDRAEGEAADDAAEAVDDAAKGAGKLLGMIAEPIAKLTESFASVFESLVAPPTAAERIAAKRAADRAAAGRQAQAVEIPDSARAQQADMDARRAALAQKFGKEMESGDLSAEQSAESELSRRRDPR